MIILEAHETVQRSEVGAFVQKALEEGVIVVVVTNNPDGQTCRVCLQRD